MSRIIHFRKFEKVDVAANILVTFLAVLNLFPLYWLITNSLKYSAAIYKMPPDWIPKTFYVKNYLELFGNQPAFRWAFNSIFVSIISTLLVVAFSSMAAYAFAKMEFKGRNTLFLLLISTLMVPKEIFIVPLFKIMIRFNWVDKFEGMIFPNLATAFGVFLLRGFFEAVPDSIRESGKLDGANEIIIFTKLIMPILKPGIGALFILNFVQVWNDYLWQLLIGNSKNMLTLMVGTATLMQELNPNFAYKLAGATVAAVPMILIFLIFQKYFTGGITMGAVKG